MKPEAQRIAIAEACGWKPDWRNVGPNHEKIAGWWEPKGNFKIKPDCLPDYLNDLNAMHEAEKVLTDEQAVWYRHRLACNSDGPKRTFDTVEAAMVHATAAQRAEAFLRTLNLWTD